MNFSVKKEKKNEAKMQDAIIHFGLLNHGKN